MDNYFSSQQYFQLHNHLQNQVVFISKHIINYIIAIIFDLI